MLKLVQISKTEFIDITNLCSIRMTSHGLVFQLNTAGVKSCEYVVEDKYRNQFIQYVWESNHGSDESLLSFRLDK